MAKLNVTTNTTRKRTISLSSADMRALLIEYAKSKYPQMFRHTSPIEDRHIDVHADGLLYNEQDDCAASIVITTEEWENEDADVDAEA